MIQDYFLFLKKIISIFPFNTFDYIMILALSLYVFEDASFGFIPAGMGFLSALASFFAGLIIYHPLSTIISKNISLTKGISDALSFFIVTIIAYALISGALSFMRRKYVRIEFPKLVNILGGSIFGFLSFFFISSFAVALLLSLPVSNTIKNSIRQSITGRFLASRTQFVEGYVRQIFGGAIDETINFLTVEPQSSQSVELNFKTKSYRTDTHSEDRMAELINFQRQANGLHALSADARLSSIARNHAKDMIERGYFSHYTPEGLSPFDRMADANIYYTFAGENLAFAPDVQIAMDGLMKSPGHRENILSPNFRKVGVGVIDAGIYGEMFVQEFTD